MSKQSLLLVDGDARSLRVLEVSLRKAGFTVTPAVSVKDALDKLEVHTPDLIISETAFPTELDGFELRRRLRANTDWAEIPFVFLTAEIAIENKIRGLELGVDDYLTKPIYIKEIVTRINILLQKRQRQYFDQRKDGVRFAGRVADMPVVDVIQTIEVSRKSGVIKFVGLHGRQAAIYFRDGKVIDAEAGTLQGEDAVYRLLTWNEGEFEVVFRTVRRRDAIATSSQGLLMEGMRRLDEWSRLLEQLPPLGHRFEVDTAELVTRLGDVPDDNNQILRLIDGKRTLLEVIDASDFGDLECLQAIARLYFEGLLIDLDPEERPPKRDTGRPMPLVVVEELSPFEEVASGEINLADLAARANEELDAAPRRSPPPVPPVESDESAGAAEQESRSSSEVIDDSDEVSAEPLADTSPGPLMGGYRPSSLRLIDEAVAAAQAIEPSLFEDEASAAEEPPPATGAAETAAEDASAGSAVARVKLARVRASRVDDMARADAEVARSSTTDGVAPSEEAGVDDHAPRARPKTAPPPIPPAKRRRTAKIDAQVEVADAIEPEDYSAIPTVIEAEKDPMYPTDEAPTQPLGRLPAMRRDESRMRMIGSHGRDRAEASGELIPPKARPAPRGEPMRELVTIMPRKNARDAEADEVVEADEIVEADDAAPPAPPASPVEAPPRRRMPPPTPPPPPPRRVAAEGGGVRRSSGPGPGAKVLLGLAALMSGATVYMYCHNPARHSSAPPSQASGEGPDQGSGSDQVVAAGSDVADGREPVAFGIDAGAPVGFGMDAAVAVRHPGDAAVAVHHPRDAATVAVRPPADAAAVAHPRVDARTQVAFAVDAGTVPRPVADAAVVTVRRPDAAAAAPEPADRTAEAKALLQQAHDALEDGDPDKALELTDASLKLHRTARTYLERARALQRLGRIDDAVASVDEAIGLVASFAPAYEQKGMILWSARRYDEARAALTKYLEIDPNARDAASIRKMLDEHR